jgi:hypothetical protein
MNLNLKGKRTYILSIGAVLAALVSYLAGDMSLGEAVQSGLLGAGLAALRAGVADSKP